MPHLSYPGTGGTMMYTYLASLLVLRSCMTDLIVSCSDGGSAGNIAEPPPPPHFAPVHAYVILATCIDIILTNWV